MTQCQFGKNRPDPSTNGWKFTYGFVGNDGVNWWDYLGLENVQQITTYAKWSGAAVAIIVRCCDGNTPEDFYEGPGDPDEEGCCEFLMHLTRQNGYQGGRGGVIGTDISHGKLGSDPSFSRFDRRQRALANLFSNIRYKVANGNIPGIGNCKFVDIIQEDWNGEPDPFEITYEEKLQIVPAPDPKPINPMINPIPPLPEPGKGDFHVPGGDLPKFVPDFGGDIDFGEPW
jgi:hypothetical protein